MNPRDFAEKVLVTDCLVEYLRSIQGRAWYRECVIQVQVAHFLLPALLDTGSLTTLIFNTFVKLNAASAKLALLAFREL